MQYSFWCLCVLWLVLFYTLDLFPVVLIPCLCRHALQIHLGFSFGISLTGLFGVQMIVSDFAMLHPILAALSVCVTSILLVFLLPLWNCPERNPSLDNTGSIFADSTVTLNRHARFGVWSCHKAANMSMSIQSFVPIWVLYVKNSSTKS